MDESVKHYTLTLLNDIKAVPQLNSFIESVLPWDGTMLMTIKLALEEAVVNVMNYAYPDNVTGEVTVDVFLEEKRLRIVITDGGRPFDPTEMADVDTTLPLEKRKVGGLGIHFIRQLMDTTDYERRDGNNVLTLTKMIKN